MKKHLRYLVAAGVAAALLLAAGCGGDDGKDKKAAEKPAVKTSQAAQQTEKKAEAPKVRPKDGEHYYYPKYIDDVSKTPPMTPEMVKYVDDFYSQIQLNPSEKGKFINDSKIVKPDEKYHRLWFHAYGSNHNTAIKFKNSKGKDVFQQEVYHIEMTTEAATNKVTYLEYHVYEQNTNIPDGQVRVIMKKKF